MLESEKTVDVLYCTVCSNCQRQEEGVVFKRCVCKVVSYCSSTCQRSHWKSHKLNCSPYLMRDIEGKGKGLVASRNIVAGETLLAEYPIIKHEGWVKNEAFEKFMEKFQCLTEQEKLSFLSLYDPEEKSKVVNKDMISNSMKECGSIALTVFKVWRIFWANSIYIGDTNGEKVKGVYATISRINHSCSPNAVFGLKDYNSDYMVITACKEIRKHEEILVNYIGAESIFNLRYERKIELEDGWAFDCTCEVCSLSVEDLNRNEEVRKQIKWLKQKVRCMVDPDVE